MRKLIDMIPSIDPETGDTVVNFGLAFIAGFIVAYLIFNG